MSATPALSAPSAGAPFDVTTIQRRELGEQDVLIDIKFCGICHSDIHQVKDEWGGSIFPMVPGHEIAGVVSAVGSACHEALARRPRGRRAAWSTPAASASTARRVRSSSASRERSQTYNGREYDGEPTFGGYSQQVVVDRPLRRQDPRQPRAAGRGSAAVRGDHHLHAAEALADRRGRTKVAVIGMGGLGHVAVKIAAAMGAEVTVLSQTLSKQEDGLRFGAKHYYATSEERRSRELAGSFDFILNTVSADLDINAYMRLLRVDGTLVNVGAPSKPVSVVRSR